MGFHLHASHKPAFVLSNCFTCHKTELANIPNNEGIGARLVNLGPDSIFKSSRYGVQSPPRPEQSSSHNLLRIPARSMDPSYGQLRDHSPGTASTRQAPPLPLTADSVGPVDTLVDHGRAAAVDPCTQVRSPPTHLMCLQSDLMQAEALTPIPLDPSQDLHGLSHGTSLLKSRTWANPRETQAYDPGDDSDRAHSSNLPPPPLSPAGAGKAQV